MSLHNHLVELKKRHDALDRQLSTELLHPGADGAKLADLKRRKLHLKDEINRLRDKPLH